MADHTITMRLWAPDYMRQDDIEESVLSKMRSQGSYLIVSCVKAEKDGAPEEGDD